MIPLVTASGFVKPAAASGGGGGGLPTQALNLVRASDQYLSMTSANFGAWDRAKWAISVWVNPQIGGSINQTIMGTIAGGEAAFRLRVDVNDQVNIATYQDGTTIAGQLTAAAPLSSGYSHILFWYDSANATAGNRMRLWINGSEVTSFDVDTNPTAAVYDTTEFYVGKVSASTQMNGLIYQLAFFSGTLPDISTLYSAGSPLSVVGLTGLWSYLDVAGGDVTSDGVLSAAWTNNNTVTASSTIPS